MDPAIVATGDALICVAGILCGTMWSLRDSVCRKVLLAHGNDTDNNLDSEWRLDSNEHIVTFT